MTAVQKIVGLLTEEDELDMKEFLGGDGSFLDAIESRLRARGAKWRWERYDGVRKEWSRMVLDARIPVGMRLRPLFAELGIPGVEPICYSRGERWNKFRVAIPLAAFEGRVNESAREKIVAAATRHKRSGTIGLGATSLRGDGRPDWERYFSNQFDGGTGRIV